MEPINALINEIQLEEISGQETNGYPYLYRIARWNETSVAWFRDINLINMVKAVASTLIGDYHVLQWKLKDHGLGNFSDNVYGPLPDNLRPYLTNVSGVASDWIESLWSTDIIWEDGGNGFDAYYSYPSLSMFIAHL